MTVIRCKNFFNAANNVSHLQFDFLICLSLATLITENLYSKQHTRENSQQSAGSAKQCLLRQLENIKPLLPPWNQRNIFEGLGLDSVSAHSGLGQVLVSVWTTTPATVAQCESIFSAFVSVLIVPPVSRPSLSICCR